MEYIKDIKEYLENPCGEEYDEIGCLDDEFQWFYERMIEKHKDTHEKKWKMKWLNEGKHHNRRFQIIWINENNEMEEEILHPEF